MSTPPVPERAAPRADERERDLDALWARHRGAHDPEARRALIASYFPLVRHVARKLASSLPQRVELGDLEGYGAEGLVEAVDRFELGRGAQFTTFAAHRIRGAILDGLRAADWAPRSVRRQAREIEENYSYLSIERHRSPTEKEEAGALGLDVPSLRAAKARIAGAEIFSLDQRISPGNGVGREPADAAADPGSVVAERAQSRALAEGVRTLSERERQVTLLSFNEGMTLAAIGRLLGVTESRVCQIRSQAIRQLRAHVLADEVVS